MCSQLSRITSTKVIVPLILMIYDVRYGTSTLEMSQEKNIMIENISTYEGYLSVPNKNCSMPQGSHHSVLRRTNVDYFKQFSLAVLFCLSLKTRNNETPTWNLSVEFRQTVVQFAVTIRCFFHDSPIDTVRLHIVRHRAALMVDRAQHL